MKVLMRFTLITSLVLLSVTISLAQEEESARHRPPTTDPTARVVTTRQTSRPSDKEAKEREKQTDDKIKVTEHTLHINNKELRFKATVGTLPQKDETGSNKADIFFVAYELLPRDEESKSPSSQPSSAAAGEGAKQNAATSPTTRPASTRPVTFVFNGGPGAASVWLHIGTAGPKRVDLDDEGNPTGPPYRLVDNESTWLDATDLVFIDPVGTGYSRPAPGEKGEQFFGVTEDVKSVASFIRLWTTRYQRWLSPKFLAGESYGTTRAAGLSEHLLDRHGISLNGILLISSVLNFQTLSPGPGNELPYPLYVPSYAANAWYHKKLAADLQSQPLEKLLKEVESWSMNEYLTALGKGEALPEADTRVIADRLSRYTGLPVDWILKSDLRVPPNRFMKQLLSDQRKIIGRFDGRMTGLDPDPINPDPAFDPSLSVYLGPYTADFNHYVRTELKYENDLPYEVLSGRVHPWNFGPGGNGYLYVADNLRDTMLKNPQLKVLFASGWMDLATAYFATDYTIEHMDLPKPLRASIIRKYYPAGHMMYHDAPSRRKLHDDITDFITSALTR